ARAATEDGRDTLADLAVAGRRVRAQEIERRHQHAGRAEAALQPVMLAKRLLQRMELSVAHQALHRSELGAVGLDGEHDARARGLAVEQDRTRAADPVLATDMRAGEPQILADEVDQQLARLASPLVSDAVDLQSNGHHVSHARLRSP